MISFECREYIFSLLKLYFYFHSLNFTEHKHKKLIEREFIFADDLEILLLALLRIIFCMAQFSFINGKKIKVFNVKKASK